MIHNNNEIEKLKKALELINEVRGLTDKDGFQEVAAEAILDNHSPQDRSDLRELAETLQLFQGSASMLHEAAED